jgi:hypothetical protein
MKHWLLQWGAEATVESPTELVAWFRTDTEQMAAGYR